MVYFVKTVCSVPILSTVKLELSNLLLSCVIQWLALLPCLQTIRVSDRDSRTVIGRTRHVTSPIWSRIDWLTGPKMHWPPTQLIRVECCSAMWLWKSLLCSGFNPVCISQINGHEAKPALLKYVSTASPLVNILFLVTGDEMSLSFENCYRIFELKYISIWHKRDHLIFT